MLASQSRYKEVRTMSVKGSRKVAVAGVIAALALTPPAAIGGDRDCERAVERLAEAQIALAEAKSEGASRKEIKRLKKKVKKAERRVKEECDSPR